LREGKTAVSALPQLPELDPAKLRDELVREQLLLTPQQVANILNTSTDWLERLAVKGKGPPRLKFGTRTHRYSMAGVQAWLLAINKNPSLLEEEEHA
jgi:hypothetical protein